jgi:hypothetical protein
MGAGRAVKQQSKADSKQTRRVARRPEVRRPAPEKTTQRKAVSPRTGATVDAQPISVPPSVENAAQASSQAQAMAKGGPISAITWDDPKLDRRIIEGMLTDRNALVSELAGSGITAAAIVRRAADLGLSEAYLRHVQTVAADLAGDRPGARRVPSSLAARDCLSCNRVFLSSGPGNRICPRCRGADAGLAQL